MVLSILLGLFVLVVLKGILWLPTTWCLFVVAWIFVIYVSVKGIV